MLLWGENDNRLWFHFAIAVAFSNWNKFLLPICVESCNSAIYLAVGGKKSNHLWVIEL